MKLVKAAFKPVQNEGSKIRLREIKKRLDVRSNSSSTFKISSSTVAQLLKKREAKKLFENKSKYSSETVPDYPPRLY